jgi:hypothetical protein
MVSFSRTERMIDRAFGLAVSQGNEDKLGIIDAGHLQQSGHRKLEEGFPVLILQGNENRLTQRSPKSTGPVENPARDKNIYTLVTDRTYPLERRLGDYNAVTLYDIATESREAYREIAVPGTGILNYTPDDDILMEVIEFSQEDNSLY